MQANVGGLDRILRIIVGLVMIAYALGYIAPETGYNVWGWIGVVPLATAIFKFCPAYSILGIKTCKS